MNNRTETREAIRGFRDDPELARLGGEFPHGLPDRDTNDRVLRAVVSAMQRGLAASRVPLRLRLEPVAFDSKGSAVSPTRMTLIDGGCRWRFDIQNLSNALMIGGQLCVTGDRDDAVQRIAETLLVEIERALGLSEGEPND